MILRRQAYDALTRQLIDRRLLPGQFVTQKELAELTGFPLGAVREMIPRLEAEGLIRTIPQRGLQVMQPDVTLIREAFEIREILEQTALARYIAVATDEMIEEQNERLEAIRIEAKDGIADDLLARAQAVDWSFHDALANVMDNRLFSEIHRVNSIRIRMMTPDRVVLSEVTLPPAVAEHRAILDGILARDATVAAQALRRHISSARRRALGIETEDDQLPH